MEPVLERLERDLQTKVRRINVSRRREFYGLLEAMGHDECGTLPFYYNRKTAQAVVRKPSYLNLKRWATGDLRHLFQDPPENMFEHEVDNSRKRKVGAGGFLQEKLVGGGSSSDGKGGNSRDRRGHTRHLLRPHHLKNPQNPLKDQSMAKRLDEEIWASASRRKSFKEEEEMLSINSKYCKSKVSSIFCKITCKLVTKKKYITPALYVLAYTEKKKPLFSCAFLHEI